MSIPPELLKFQEPIPVLNQGYIKLIDVMGTDLSIVNSARVSYKKAKKVQNDQSLLRYLMRHKHWSPFEMCEIVLQVRLPIYVERQWVRHRTASTNEMSGRYTEYEKEFHVAENWRLQSPDNKQGSKGEIEEIELIENLSKEELEIHNRSWDLYQERLKLGMAKEQARKDLPMSIYTEKIWKCDARNLMHFLHLRLDPHAQQEIREYANAIIQIVEQWIPWSWAAFNDYILQAITFTKPEINILKDIWAVEGFDLSKHEPILKRHLNGRELEEFIGKMKQING